MRLPTQLFFYRYFEISLEWNWKALLLLSFWISCDRILRFKDVTNKCDVKNTFKLKQIDIFEKVGNILSYRKEYEALDKFYEVFSRTDHPGLPAVVLSNEIIRAGRLNSIASYFNYLVWQDTHNGNDSSIWLTIRIT